MSISKKIRFEVFKRDSFTCAYCGKSPPGVILEADHIDPVHAGGKDDINNLITACFDCNRGKKHIPLTKIPKKIQENLEILQEQEAQLKEYKKFVKKIHSRELKDIQTVVTIFESAFPGITLNDRFISISMKTFLWDLLEDDKGF